MRIPIKEIEAGERLSAWVTYRDDFDVQLQQSTTKEQVTALGKNPSRTKRDRYWLSHVLDWRGLEDMEGKTIPFTAEVLKHYYGTDAGFAGWLVEESQEMDNFCGEPRSVAAESVPADNDAQGSD